MSRLHHVTMMAAYNTWMNDKVYSAAARLTDGEARRARGAFFGSILGTLNHLTVADTIWLKRFAAQFDHPALDPLRAAAMPAALDAMLFDGLAALAEHRRWLDALIERWVAALDDDDLSRTLHYANTRGDTFERETFALLMHLFNHQTHHRGQVTTLLTQAGEDVGVTDLLALIPQSPTAPPRQDGAVAAGS